jgi:phosphotransferase system  glucose/maltose/N-acetylglucosamine-specific IIC component
MDGYENITTCSCTYCDLSCPVPNVNGDIAFFDGCNWFLVGMFYTYVVIFTVVLQIIKRYYASKDDEDEKNQANKDR